MTQFSKSRLQSIRHCCCSVAKFSLTLCDPMNCSMASFPVLHYLPEFAQLMSLESVMPSNHLILCHPLLVLPSVFPRIRFFIVNQLFTSGGQSIGASALALVLPHTLTHTLKSKKDNHPKSKNDFLGVQDTKCFLLCSL